MEPPAMRVVIIASSLRLSKIIPATPNKKAGRCEKNNRNPSRIKRGLPQPGESIFITTVIMTAMVTNIDEIIPKRIVRISNKPVS
jgi:hypothetical protein